ncbi:unnamed protein product [Fraxinus pennsylvanica]|uniref:Reverse transcriptase/retrotransposon-derived protein RNase H-like domain-containing protein n=1 Tax=Fraxinus pennsylvanica TaxID=56036 RepID=A0AAD1YY12_9LAMI|nr:unnamed protein product [Fraxinus pennsylvanica]
MVNKVFRYLPGSVIEAHVDDMVVKSMKANDHVSDLQKVFNNARQNRPKFNQRSVFFGTSGGKFLGFMMTHRGIEATSNKIRAILEMKSPEVTYRKCSTMPDKIDRSSIRGVCFLEHQAAIGGSTKFEWTKECEESLESLKQSLQQLPILARPCVGYVPCLYLAVSKHAVSVVLLKEFSKVQKPVHYVSQVLKGIETRYVLAKQLAKNVHQGVSVDKFYRRAYNSASLPLSTGSSLENLRRWILAWQGVRSRHHYDRSGV